MCGYGKKREKKVGCKKSLDHKKRQAFGTIQQKYHSWAKIKLDKSIIINIFAVTELSAGKTLKLAVRV